MEYSFKSFMEENYMDRLVSAAESFFAHDENCTMSGYPCPRSGRYAQRTIGEYLRQDRSRGEQKRKRNDLESIR